MKLSAGIRDKIPQEFLFLNLAEKNMIKLQLRGGIEDNSKIFFLFLNENISCDPSLEPSWGDGSNEGSQICFFMEKYGKLSLNYTPLLIWSIALSISIHTNKVSVQILLSTAIGAEPGSTPSRLFWPIFFYFSINHRFCI